MKNSLNIASEKQPLFIDPTSITAIHTNLAENALWVYNEKGALLWIDYKSYGVDPDKLLRELASAGNTLVSFPVRDLGKEYAYHIAPSAITYATITKVGEKGDIGAIIGVKGAGRIESYNNKLEEFQALLNGMKATGKKILEFMPDVAYARWYNAAMLYIDPAAITSICDDGYQVNVYFGDSDMLDVQANREDQARRDQARRDFATAIAAVNGTLIPVTNTLQRGIYVRSEDVDYVTFYDSKEEDPSSNYKYEMRLHRQKPGSTYPDTVKAFFNSAAARSASFKELTKTVTPKTPKNNALDPTP